MIVDPNNENILYVGTSNGLFRTANAMAPNPNDVIWTRIIPSYSTVQEDFRGLAFKMNADFTFDSNVIYASSNKNVYKSTDAGATWIPLFSQNFINNHFDQPWQRVNITVTPAAPDNLYIYIITSLGNPSHYSWGKSYIYLYDGSNLISLETHNSTSIADIVNVGRMPITVSYDDPNKIYYGLTLIRYSNDGGTSFNNLSYSTAGHADIHELKFEPIHSGGNLFCGNDGGVTYGEYPFTSNSDWFQKNNGISSALLFTCGNSAIDPDYNIIANQDNGITLTQLPSYNWDHIAGGDGYAADILSKFNSGHGYFYNSNFNNSYSGISPFPLRPTEDPLNAVVASQVPSTSNLAYNPKTFEYYMGFKEIQKLNENPSNWELASDVYIRLLNMPITDPASAVANIYIPESDPNTIYAVTAGMYSDFYDFGDKPTVLFKSTTGFIHGKTEYEANNAADSPNFTIIDTGPWYNPGVGSTTFITGIAGDNISENDIWLSFSGYDDNYKVYKSTDGGEMPTNWINEDANFSLPNVPVNCIVRQKNTYDRLYIGTDVGIFYKDNTMTNWERYGDFPHVRVNEIRLNYCSKKLIVATWGRGLWEGDMLPEQNNDEEKTIDANITWTDNAWAETDVRVVSGNTLTITGTLTMPEDKQIIVEPGAKLIIDGGTITNGCGKMWKGIVVQGNSTLPQTTTNQGALYVWNGATIENAQTAVTVEGGGAIQASNSHFLNNRYDVIMEPYSNPSNPGHNVSYFTNCTFVVNDDALDYCVAHVKLDNVSGIYFRGNEFTCSMTEPPYWNDPSSPPTLYANGRSIGIWAQDADFKVLPRCTTVPPYGQPCPNPDPNEFTGLYYGIKASSTANAVGVQIDDNTFTDNYRGVLLENIQTAPEINGNTFNDGYTGLGTQFYIAFPPPYGNSTYGLYLNECTGYQVQENSFSDGDAGIFVYNSGNQTNFVNNNQFTNIDHINNASALTGLGMNSGADQAGLPIGLKFKCNNFNNNIFNMSVVGNSTISVFQGSTGQSPSDNYPAGNTFSPACTSGTSERDFFVDAASPIPMYTYYYNQNVANEEPICYTLGKVNVIGSLFNPGYCDIASPSPQPIPVIAQQLRSSQMEIDNKKAELDSLVDGGNTEYLINEVDNLTQRNYMRTCGDLLNASPYLSDTVLKTFMLNPLHRPILKIIVLMANSPLPSGVRSYIDQTNLPYIFKSILWSLQNGTNPREEKQMAIATLDGNRQFILNNLMRQVLLNDSVPETKDSLIDVLTDETDYRSLYYLIPVLISNQQYNDAQTAITDLEQAAYTLPETSRNELLDYCQLLSITEQGKEGGNMDTVVGQNIGFLESMATADGKKGTITAQLLLEHYNPTTYDYPEKTDFPNPDNNRSVKVENKPYEPAGNVSDMLNVYPNPANDKLTIEYAILNNFGTDCSIGLYDMQGNLIKSVPTGKQIGFVELDVSGIANGNYILSVCQFGNKDYSKQISIVH